MSVVLSVSSSPPPFFLFLICGLVLVYSFVVHFKFFNGHFPVTTLGLDVSLGAYLNKFTVFIIVPSD
jgi:hypothetical protein